MKKVLIATLAIASLFGASCSKKNDYSSTGFATVQTLFTSMAPQPKYVTLNATTGGTFYGNSGVRYVFPANAFRTATGAAVTGNVDIQALDVVSKADMIFTGVLPISNGRSLVSGGETYLKVTQNGQEVFMATGKMYQANIPQNGTPDPGLQLFLSNGKFDAKDTAAVNNWQPAQDTSHSVAAHGYVVVLSDSVSINADSLDWANADRFMTIPNDVSFTVTLNAGGLAIGSDIHAYALFDNYKGIWPLGVIGSISNGVITEQHTPATPLHFVVATMINGNLYGGSLAATPTTGSNYTISVTKMTAADFKALINAH